MTLESYLKQHGLTQFEFAARVGCEQPTISRFINGRVPSPEMMTKILEATDGAVTPNDFFGIPSTSESERAA